MEEKARMKWGGGNRRASWTWDLAISSVSAGLQKGGEVGQPWVESLISAEHSKKKEMKQCEQLDRREEEEEAL